MTELLEQTVGQADKLSERQLDLLVRRMGPLSALPTFAGVISRLVECISSETSPDEAIDEKTAGLIECDISLTVGLLALASRRYASARTAGQAIEIVPADVIRSHILSTQIFACPSDGLDLHGLRKHSLAVACGAKLLAERTGLADGERAFVCGLLHDVGKLVLFLSMPKSYTRALAQAETHEGNIADYERAIIGVDHAALGRRLAEHWRLDGAIVESVWLSHQPIEAIPPSLSHPKMVALVGLADTIARRQQLGFSGNHTFIRSPEQLAHQLEISPDTLKQVIEELPTSLGVVHCPLTQGEGEQPDLHYEAIRGANVQLGRINSGVLNRLELITNRAEAFSLLRDFTATLSSQATVCEALEKIADLMAAGRRQKPCPSHPIVVYSIDRQPGAIFAARCDGSDTPQWETFKTLVPPDESDDWLEALDEWIDPANCTHQPLVCANEWIGGVIFTGLDVDMEMAMTKLLAEVVALSLATIQSRSRAMELSEHLAGTSQVLVATQEAIAEARTLSAVGEMAAGAAHELNNPLAVVSGRAQLMREKAGSDDERKTWQTIIEQAEKISGIISDLMDFANPPAPNPATLDLRVILAEAKNRFSSSKDIKDTQAPAVRVDIQIGDDARFVFSDRAQTLAVFTELISNAATATASEVAVRITAQADDADDAVLLTVSDTGQGMDDDTLKRVFTPFFSSQQAGRRRGLGLPRIKRYVENNNGRIWIKSKPNEGTAVYVRLPGSRDGRE